MHIDAVPNRKARPTYLLRESFREGSRVRKRTVANLSALSDEQIAAIRCVLRGDQLCAPATLFEVIASRPHGHVQAVDVAMQCCLTSCAIGVLCTHAYRCRPQSQGAPHVSAARIVPRW